MRYLFLILILAWGLGCATTQEADVPPDIAEATSPEGTLESAAGAPGEAAPAPGGETSEADLMGGDSTQQATTAAPPAVDAPAEAAPPPPAETAAAEPPPAEVAPPPAEEPAAPAPLQLEEGKTATITALDYKANLNGGTVVIRTDRSVAYTTRKNEGTNQFILELNNTTVPKRFQRPYNTKEFKGPIASINAYQSKGSNQARVVIQLRDGGIEPGIEQDGNIISIAGSGGGGGGGNVASGQQLEVQPPAPQEAAPSTAQNDDDESQSVDTTTAEKLTSKTFADFLTGNNKFYGRPISLELKDADIRDVFRFISEESGLNLVVGDDVTGKISLKLRKIPWDQALTVILQSRQLGYIKQGSILRIAPLKTLQAESDAARSVIESQRQLEPLRVQVFPISYAKAEDLESQAKDFLSPRGRAKADRRTNTLVVTDIDEPLTKIRSLIKRLDTQTPQVLIEAKVVEARESFDRVVGVNWGFTGYQVDLSQNSQGGNVSLTPRVDSHPIDVAEASAMELGLTLGTMDVFGDLTASLKLLETERLVKVISSPRIVTLDRVAASIQQTTQFPIFESALTAQGTPTATVKFQDVKLQLDVTPQVTNDGAIIMQVTIVREFPDAPVRVGTSEARAVNKRQAQTQVLVENGDTVVIGGIYQSDVSESETGTPWLRKIPILGALFRQHKSEREKNELVIFLTPRTLNRDKSYIKSGDT